MDMGSFKACDSARFFIQSASRHSWSLSEQMMEADLGGTSVRSAKRIGLQLLVAEMLRPYKVLVRLAFLSAWMKISQAPELRRRMGWRRVSPIVEISRHRDGLGIRRPHRKLHTRDARKVHGMRSERFPGLRRECLRSASEDRSP